MDFEQKYQKDPGMNRVNIALFLFCRYVLNMGYVEEIDLTGFTRRSWSRNILVLIELNLGEARVLDCGEI